MDAIIGDSVRKTNELNEPEGSFPQQPSIKKSPPVIPSQVENEKIIITQRLSADIVPDRPDFKSCTCPPPPEKGGFFKCLYSLLVHLSQKALRLQLPHLRLHPNHSHLQLHHLLLRHLKMYQRKTKDKSNSLSKDQSLIK
ncbi:hypothetical protein MTP99_007800 [Tenebrio molitor]|nr:hypothetical protein MTP99_007800 [Tenebrio molitor]